MFFALLGNWGTHYDAPPPDFPEMGFFPSWLMLAVIPQLIIWIAYTVVIGTLVAGITSALVKAKQV